jgi:hypothetical protein
MCASDERRACCLTAFEQADKKFFERDKKILCASCTEL